MKHLLLISPDNHSIYADLITELKKMGIKADFLPDRDLNYDPDNVRAPFHTPRFIFSLMSRLYWKRLLSKPEYNKKYDYLLTIDGEALNSVVFEILRKRNPKVYCVNYLYDTISGVYRFDRYFHFYDKVFSFDNKECNIYKMNLLPIFWVPIQEQEIKYCFFAFGGYNENRYKVYNQVKQYTDSIGKESYIGLFIRKIKHEKLYILKRVIRRLLKMPVYLSIERYHDSLITTKELLPEDFRRLISSSDIIVDTHPTYQSGLTARFMWALGARKKIVTTNKDVINYPFYSKEQIFILPESLQLDNEFVNFINAPMRLSKDIEESIDKFRVDNWLRVVLSLE